MRVLLYRAMRDIVVRFKPDLVLSAYPLYQAPLNARFTLRGGFVPVVGADLTTLLAVGSKRVSGLGAALDVLSRSGLRARVAAVAGGDESLYGEDSDGIAFGLTYPASSPRRRLQRPRCP
jgi:hypothetical protein